MNKHKNLILTAFAAIIFSSCNSDGDDKRTTGNWDGVDYNTGTDTTINNQTYHFSSYGYWYYLHNDQVTRYYPRTGYSETLTSDEHKKGSFLSSPEHTLNGGATEDAATFSSGKGGTVEGTFGSTARGVSSEGSSAEEGHGGGFGESAHGGGGE